MPQIEIRYPKEMLVSTSEVATLGHFTFSYKINRYYLPWFMPKKPSHTVSGSGNENEIFSRVSEMKLKVCSIRASVN